MSLNWRNYRQQLELLKSREGPSSMGTKPQRKGLHWQELMALKGHDGAGSAIFEEQIANWTNRIQLLLPWNKIPPPECKVKLPC